MIPISDDNPTRIRPYVVYALVALNILVYLIDITGPRTPLGGRLWTYSLVPWSVKHNEPYTYEIPQQSVQRYQLPDGRILQKVEVRKVTMEHTGLTPQWLTIFTSMFMHGGLLHIAGNLLFLLVFGNNIEDALGHGKFLIFYLVCGVGAALAQIMSNPESTVPMVGASGAIAGVLGAYLLLHPRATVNTLITLGFIWPIVQLPAVLVLGAWFLIQLVGLGGTGGQVGGGGGVAYWAHVGGFVAGVVIILLLGGNRLTRGRQAERRYRQSPYHDWDR